MACAAFISVTGGIEVLAAATNALVYLMFLVVNVVLVTLRYQQPLTPRPFRVWWSIGWVPVVPCLGIIATLALSRELEMQPLLAAFALLSAGLLLYFMNQSRK
jgi:APA family basic amino acid/polyamine antiporter